MKDIADFSTDLVIVDSNVPKAANILDVQLASLTYAPAFGIDKNYFLNPDFEFKNEAFKAYVLQRLAESGIDVLSTVETVETLYSNIVFNLSGTEENGGLIR